MRPIVLIRHAREFWNDKDEKPDIRLWEVEELVGVFQSGKLPWVIFWGEDVSIIGVCSTAFRSQRTLDAIMWLLWIKDYRRYIFDQDNFDEGSTIPNLIRMIREKVTQSANAWVLCVGHLEILDEAKLPYGNCQGAVIDFDSGEVVARIE